MKIGMLGCGKIGRALAREISEKELGEVIFIQDPAADEAALHEAAPSAAVVRAASAALYAQADLVIESATASALKENIELILKNCDLMMFSVTAMADQAFEERARALAAENGTRIFVPHGAILGLDGIFDGKNAWERVSIVTTKSPKSLGRTDTERTLVYEGSTREVCGLYPRNVNVHAAIALAGIGFDRTQSKIISDPAVSTNAHVITVSGPGMDIELHVSSYANGGITGAYTPLSACGSLHRILDRKGVLQIV